MINELSLCPSPSFPYPLPVTKYLGTCTVEMNPTMHNGRSVGDQVNEQNNGRSVGEQVNEQTIPGHVNPDPSILMGGVSNINTQQQHHGFSTHQTDFGASTSSNFYYPFVDPLAAPRLPAVPINYGSPDQLMSTYNNMPVFGASSDEFARNHFKVNNEISYKRKNAETTVGSSHCHPYESTSSSANPPVDTTHVYCEHPPQYGGGNRFVSIANDNNDRSMRVTSGAAGINLIHPNNYNGFIHGIHGAESFQPANAFPFDQAIIGNPLLGPVYHASLPYMHGHGDHNLPQPPQTQVMRQHCFQFRPQVPTPHFPLPNGASRIPMSSPFVPRPRGSSRQIRIRTNNPQTRGWPEIIQIHRNIPYLRYIDEVAIIDLPEHHTDHHSDMRMDIEHMSYEELLALGDHIGNVNTGLSEESITNHLQTRRYELPSTYADVKESESLDGETVYCIICMGDYQDQEELGCLDCGHDYHADCLKKWMLVKNVCPICKTKALPS